jgi:signal transduction histidine kinase/ActR/RegA family two-component response regulator
LLKRGSVAIGVRRLGVYAFLMPAIAVGFWTFALLRVAGAQPLARSLAASLMFGAGCVAFALLVAAIVTRGARDQRACEIASAAAAQAHRLNQLTSALAQAGTSRTAIEAIVQEPLYTLQAETAALFLVSADGQTAQLARAVGYPEGREPAPVPLSTKGGISDAVARTVPVFVETPKARAIVPLVIGNRVNAVVQFDFHSARTFTADDRDYFAALTHSGAYALDRVRQMELAERGRKEAEHLRAQADRELLERRSVEHALRASETRYRALAARTSRLHTLSTALSQAVTVEAVGRAVITHGRVAVGASAGEVLLLVDDGAGFETLHAEAEGRRDLTHGPVLVEDGWCEAEAVKTRHPVFIRSLEEWQQRFWRSASLAADGGYESSATMPLLVEGAPLGVLTFHFTVPVNFDEEYQALLASVAEHCAQALDRARLYESTQRARADAERANRIKDEFVSIVSHELRTPLNAILGWTTMLQRGALPPEKSARALQSVHENATRQARLIEELLDFSRVTSGRAPLQIERVDLRELIRGVVESMIPTAVARTVELQLSPIPPVEVRGDSRRLEQVCFNLVDNALKFTPAGGRVTIDVRLIDGHVEIQVQDTGAGIDPAFLPHVFDRFRQADSSTSRTYGGLGLGLSIAKQLVEAHEGTISATSEGKGQGSTFVVRLPIVPQPAAGEERRKTPRPDKPAEVRLDGVRVLVVDDEPDAREIMGTALTTAGATVEVASDAREAFGLVGKGDVDVLVSDIAMPDEDGLALIQKIRSSREARVANVPAAAVTAFTSAMDRDRALAAGFQVHLSKPFEPSQLVRIVWELSDRPVRA